MAAAQAGLKRAELDLERTDVKAPFSGRLRMKHVDLGEFVNRGTPLANVYSVEVAEVHLPVADQELKHLNISLGKRTLKDPPEVTLRADFGGQAQEWKAKIVRTGGEIDRQTRMVNLIARGAQAIRGNRTAAASVRGSVCRR